ncbi:recombination regulator RecX [Bacillus timonensis]|nr:recombination regulator RecX [Bacillus timonensis]
MAIITKITTQKKNKERFNIYLDSGKGEEYAFSVDQDILIKHGLKKGMEFDELEFEEILFEDQVKKAFNLAINFLSYRMRSIKEVEDYLRKKEVEEPIIPEVIHKLSQYKYVNDQEFAIAFVRTQMNTSIKGPQVIRNELMGKGVASHIIDASLEEFETDFQIEQAMIIVEKIMRQSSKLSDVQTKQKIEQALRRKGYTWDIIQKALFRVQDQQEEIADENEDSEWEALVYQAEKADRKYQKFQGLEYHQKMKQTLYRKGFSIDLIERYLQEKEEM